MKIEVTNAVINGKKHGEQLVVDAKSAHHLINIGYAKEVVEKAEPPKPKPAPKARKKTNDDK